MTVPHRNEVTAENLVPFLADIFDRRGDEEYLGEPVTMSEHMLQGAHFAEQAGEPEIVIVAALLHDIGHFTSEFGTFAMTDTKDRYHEQAGADLLEQFLPPLVVDCVRHHVAAKRYLCATEPAYLAELSEASVHSLNLQGGPMNEDEMAQFAQNPNLQAILRVRKYDDAGKQAGLKTQPFAHYAPMIARVVAAHSGSAGTKVH